MRQSRRLRIARQGYRRPRYLITAEGRLTMEQAEQIKERWLSAAKRRDPIILSGVTVSEVYP